MIFSFTSKVVPELREVGGKAQSLIEMTQEAFPVPPGFVLSVEFFEPWMEKVQRSAAWKAFLKSSPPDLKKHCDALKKSCERLRMNAQQKNALQEALKQMSKEILFAVRSSSPEEDLEGASFAGAYETTLGVTTKNLEKAVLTSFRSVFDERIVSYKLQHGMKTHQPRIAVIVQQQIASEVSGVAFSSNPQNNRDDEAVINANFGLGESIVSGQVTPDSFVVKMPNHKILEKRIANKTHAIWLKKGGGTVTKNNPEPSKPSLTTAQAKQVARLVGNIEQHCGQPMDIEWAYHKGKLYLLQARPITASLAHPKPEWIPDDPKAMLVRSSIVELLPDPLSPYYESIARTAVVEGLSKTVKLLGNINIKQQWHFRFPVLNGYGYYQMRFGLWQYLSTIPLVLRLYPWLFKQCIPNWKDLKTPQFLQQIEQWKNRSIQKMRLQELLEGGTELTTHTQEYYTATQAMLPVIYMSEAVFMGYYNRFVRRKGDPPFETYVMGYDSTPINADKSLYDIAMWTKKQKKLATLISKTSNEELKGFLIRKTAPKGVGGEVFKAWQQHWQIHLDSYGHLIYDLDVAKAVPADSPEPLFGTMKYYLSGKGVNPYERQEKTIKEREAATKKMLKRLGFIRRYFFRKLLRFAQSRVPYREDGLASIGLGYPVARKLLLELGNRLKKKGVIDESKDVFWLKKEELLEICKRLDAGKKEASQDLALAERKKIWKWQRSLTPPPVIAQGFFMKKMMGWYFPEQSDEHKGKVMKGLGASRGTVTGTARVILSPDQFDQMQPGDILVTAITTPAWTPLFALASGVVTDVGGALSHSSIVAREYGIPAVLGTGVASKQIKNGQRITVNGDTGEVKVRG